MRDVLRLVWFDLKELIYPPVWVGLQWFTYIVQIFIYAALISQMVVGIPDYRSFYAVGFAVIMTFDVGSHTGRQFVEHAHEGRLPYLLSLPISRMKLFLSIALKGAFELALTLAVPFAVFLYLIHSLTAISMVEAAAALFFLGFGVAGLMLGLSFIAFKSSDMYVAITTGLSAVLIRFSTSIYPLASLAAASSGYGFVARFSPLTYGADLVHNLLGFNSSMLLNPMICLAALIALGISTLSLGVLILGRLVEGVKSG
jgi:hypothetical protein